MAFVDSDEHRALWQLYAVHFPDDVPDDVADVLAGREAVFAGAGGMPALTKAQFDALLNAVIQNIDGGINQGVQIETFLLAHPDADFTAAAGGPGPTGYTSGDIATVKSGYSDLNQLSTIYTGAANLATAKDFRAFIKLLADLVH